MKAQSIDVSNPSEFSWSILCHFELFLIVDSRYEIS